MSDFVLNDFGIDQGIPRVSCNSFMYLNLSLWAFFLLFMWHFRLRHFQSFGLVLLFQIKFLNYILVLAQKILFITGRDFKEEWNFSFWLFQLVYLSCRNWPSQPLVFKGHTDGISGFSVWGQDVISISKNKIGLSSLSKSADGVLNQHYI